MKITQFIAEPSDFFIAGNSVLTHTGTKFFDTGGGEIESSFNQGAFFPLILTARFRINQVNGPACLQLGTEKNGFIDQLGEVEFNLGVIAGNKSINPFLSLLIPGEDDGKVAVERTKIDGMNDFRVFPCSHSFFMSRRKVQNQVRFYLSEGSFMDDS